MPIVFSNLHSKPPKGIQSIAFEAIYDTSQKVRPHELLWESLQRAFAANGKLRVTSVAEADAFMQAQITRATSSQGSPTARKNAAGDPEYDPKAPALPSSYKKLGQAAVLADTQNQTMRVEIKVWHLRTKELLFTKSYAVGTGNYRLLDNSTTPDNQFLRAEEAFHNRFSQMSTNLASIIVRDLLRSR